MIKLTVYLFLCETNQANCKHAYPRPILLKEEKECVTTETREETERTASFSTWEGTQFPYFGFGVIARKPRVGQHPPCVASFRYYNGTVAEEKARTTHQQVQ